MIPSQLSGSSRQWLLIGSVILVGVVVFAAVVVSTGTLRSARDTLVSSPSRMSRLTQSINTTLNKARRIDESLITRMDALGESAKKIEQDLEHHNLLKNKLTTLETKYAQLVAELNKNDISSNKIDDKVKESVGSILRHDRQRLSELETKTRMIEVKTLVRLLELEKTVKRLNNSYIETKITCPIGTVQVRTECFTFHMDHRPWQGSYDFCLDQGGFMPEFNNPDLEFMEIVRAIPELEKKIREDSRSSVPFWLNAKDIIKEGEWIWGSGARLFLNDTRWAPGQPNNHGGGQHCLIVDYDKSKGFDNLTVGLEDNPCNLSFNIICEYTPIITY